MDEKSYLSSNILLGFDSLADLNLQVDTQERLSSVLKSPSIQNSQVPSFNYSSNFKINKNLLLEDLYSINKDNDKKEGTLSLDDAMLSDNPEISKRASSIYNSEILPKLDRSLSLSTGIITPYQKGQEKFTDDNWYNESGKTKYGFNPYKSLAENEDFYHENVWDEYSKAGKLWRGVGTFAGRVAEGVASGLGKTVSYLGSAVLYGGAELASVINGTPGKWRDGSNINFISSVSDNSVARWLEEQDESFKEQVLPVWKSIDYDNKGFFSKMTNATFWQEDFADMASFALQAMIPSVGFAKLGQLGKLQGASKFMRALGKEAPGKFGSILEFATGAKNISGVGGWAFNTANEAFFEAAGVQKSIKENLLNARKQGLNDYTDEEINQAAAEGASKDFAYNIGILSLSNAFENKLFGKLVKGTGEGIKPRVDILDDLSAVAGKTNWKRFATYLDPINYLEKIPMLGKNFAQNSRLGFYSRTLVGLPAYKAIAMEGLWEENAQLAAQRISEGNTYTAIIEGGGERKNRIEDGNAFTKFAKQLGKQTIDAATGKDVEAATSIGSGGLLGSVMTTGIAKATKERSKTNTLTADYVDRLNKSRANIFKYTDIYQKDDKGNLVLENGKPKIDNVKKKTLLDTIATINDKIDIANSIEGKSELKDHLFKSAFADYMHDAFRAGVDDAVINSINNFNNKSNEELAIFGFDKKQLNNSPEEYVQFAKDLKSIFNKIENINYVNNSEKDVNKFNNDVNALKSSLYSLNVHNRLTKDNIDSLLEKHSNSFKDEEFDKIVYDANDESITYSLFGLLQELNLNQFKIIHFENLSEEYNAVGYKADSKIKELKQRNKAIIDRYSSIYNIKENDNGLYVEDNKIEYINDDLQKAAELSNHNDILSYKIDLLSDINKGVEEYNKLKPKEVAKAQDDVIKAEEESVAAQQSSLKEEEEKAVLKETGFTFKINDKEYKNYEELNKALEKDEITLEEFNKAVDEYNVIADEFTSKEDGVSDKIKEIVDKILNNEDINQEEQELLNLYPDLANKLLNKEEDVEFIPLTEEDFEGEPLILPPKEQIYLDTYNANPELFIAWNDVIGAIARKYSIEVPKMDSDTSDEEIANIIKYVFSQLNNLTNGINTISYNEFINKPSINNSIEKIPSIDLFQENVSTNDLQLIVNQSDVEKIQEEDEQYGAMAYNSENKTTTRETVSDEKGKDVLNESKTAYLLKNDPYDKAVQKFLKEELSNNLKYYSGAIVRDREEWIKSRIPKANQEEALSNIGYALMIKDDEGNTLYYDKKTNSIVLENTGIPVLYSIDKDNFKDRREERAEIKKNRTGISLSIPEIIAQYEKQEDDKLTAFNLLENNSQLEIPVELTRVSNGIFKKAKDSKLVKDVFGNDFDFLVTEPFNNTNISKIGNQVFRQGMIVAKPKNSEEYIPIFTRKITADEADDIFKLINHNYNTEEELDKVINYIKSVVYLSDKYHKFTSVKNEDGTYSIVFTDLEGNKEKPVVLTKRNYNVSRAILNSSIEIPFLSNNILSFKKENYKTFLSDKLMTNVLPFEENGKIVLKSIQHYVEFDFTNLEELVAEDFNNTFSEEIEQNKQENIELEQSEIEAKIADIEKRRQQELGNTVSLNGNLVPKGQEVDKINAKYDAELAALESANIPSLNTNNSLNDGKTQQIKEKESDTYNEFMSSISSENEEFNLSLENDEEAKDSLPTDTKKGC